MGGEWSGYATYALRMVSFELLLDESLCRGDVADVAQAARMKMSRVERISCVCVYTCIIYKYMLHVVAFEYTRFVSDSVAVPRCCSRGGALSCFLARRISLVFGTWIKFLVLEASFMVADLLLSFVGRGHGLWACRLQMATRNGGL